MEAWLAFSAGPGISSARERLYALLITWVRHQPRLKLQKSEAAYDSFVDRIITDLPKQAPHLGTLRLYFNRSLADAARKAAHQRCAALEADDDLDGHGPQPVDVAIEREYLWLTACAASSIPRVAKRILSLRVCGDAFSAIALDMGIREGTARSLCSRTRKALSRNAWMGSLLAEAPQRPGKELSEGALHRFAWRPSSRRHETRDIPGH